MLIWVELMHYLICNTLLPMVHWGNLIYWFNCFWFSLATPFSTSYDTGTLIAVIKYNKHDQIQTG